MVMFVIIDSMFRLNKKIVIGIGLILVVLIIIFLDLIFKKSPPIPNSGPNSKDASATNEKELNQNNKQQAPAAYNGPDLPRYAGRPIGEVRFGQGFSAPEEYIAKQKKDLALLGSVLNKNPISVGGVDNWIAVGVIKKSFNDYEGARDAWEYANILYPSNGLSFANLGNLYGFYLHDNEKAEASFKKAISNDAYQPGYYLGLADFYKNVYMAKKSETPKVLLEGMNIIKDVNLVLYLASYYRDEGDKANALKYYQEVLKLSPGHPGISDEVARLK